MEHKRVVYEDRGYIVHETVYTINVGCYPKTSAISMDKKGKGYYRQFEKRDKRKNFR